MCAPKAPSPTLTAQAQTASNKETAIANAGLGMVNQTDALGNQLNYSQIGSWSDGTPRFSATQTLSAPQQQLLETGQKTSQNLANLAQEQTGRISGLLSEPLDWSSQQNYLNDLTAQNLNPQWDRMAQQNEQSLINRGIRPGSAQYTQAQDDFSRSRSSAFNDANLNNFNSALQSQITLRNQPLQEILALAGQGQLQNPQFTNTPTAQMAGTDVGGITNSAYNANLSSWNANQGLLGGLFKAGASAIPLLSDRRMKTDIRPVGKLDNGLTVFVYRYIDGGPFHLGLMADDVKELHPSAVERGPDGFDRVRYLEAVA